MVAIVNVESSDDHRGDLPEVDLTSIQPKLPPDDDDIPAIDSEEGGCQEKGKTLLIAGDYAGAIKQFEYALRSQDYVLNKGVFDTDEMMAKKAEVESMKVSTLMNKAHAHMKLRQWHDCINGCESALELEQRNIKALYRIIKCHYELAQYDEADQVLLQCKNDIDYKKGLSRALGRSEAVEGEKAIAALELQIAHAKQEYKRNFKKIAASMSPAFVTKREPLTLAETAKRAGTDLLQFIQDNDLRWMITLLILLGAFWIQSNIQMAHINR